MKYDSIIFRVCLFITAVFCCRPVFAWGVFQDSLSYEFILNGKGSGNTPMPVSFDGSNYWAAEGGVWYQDVLQKYDSKGGLIGEFGFPKSASEPFWDFRSTFSDVSGTIYARMYSDNGLYRMDEAAVFTHFLDLEDPKSLLDAQAPVTFSPDQRAFAARNGALIQLWERDSGKAGSVIELKGYGSEKGEGEGDQNDLDLAACGAYYLTYVDRTDMLYAWDDTGSRVGGVQLNAGDQHSTAYSFSQANGFVFLAQNSDAYLGFRLETAAPAVTPEPRTSLLMLVGIAIGAIFGLPYCRRRQNSV